MKIIQEYYRQFLEEGNEENLDWIWQAVVFCRWLQQAQLAG